MIARMWRGGAVPSNADAYETHFTTHVAPHLQQMAGHQGACLLRRETQGEVEFLAITFWESLESVSQFAGPDPNVAIVEDDARAVLSTFDDFASHYEVAYKSVS